MSNPLKIKRRLIFLGGMTMSFIVAFSVATNACTRIFWNDNGITCCRVAALIGIALLNLY